jgi:hypothetical protein
MSRTSVAKHPAAQDDELRAKSGEPAPLSGRWQSVDTSETVRYYEKDELLARDMAANCKAGSGTR